MTVKINGIKFKEVLEFTHNECEVLIVFSAEHPYDSIKDLEQWLNAAGLHLGNYHFNGKDAYGNDNGHLVLEPVYHTSVLCTYHGDLQVECRP